MHQQVTDEATKQFHPHKISITPDYLIAVKHGQGVRFIITTEQTRNVPESFLDSLKTSIMRSQVVYYSIRGEIRRRSMMYQ